MMMYRKSNKAAVDKQQYHQAGRSRAVGEQRQPRIVQQPLLSQALVPRNNPQNEPVLMLENVSSSINLPKTSPGHAYGQRYERAAIRGQASSTEFLFS